MLHVPFLNCHSARKIHCCFKYHPTKPQVIENKICEGTDRLNVAYSSGMTSLQVMVPSTRGLGHGSDEKVTLLYVIP
jgi:hypothetical protein